MTEQDVLRRQEINGQTEFYLVLVGQFYHAYGNGAFALSRASGYRVLRKQRRWGEVLTAGFPASVLARVRQRIADMHGTVREVEGKMLLFSGIDGTPDDSLVQASQPVSVPAGKTAVAAVTDAPDEGTLLADLMSFNLSAATPIEAMLFLSNLQRKYGTK